MQTYIWIRSCSRRCSGTGVVPGFGCIAPCMSLHIQLCYRSVVRRVETSKILKNCISNSASVHFVQFPNQPKSLWTSSARSSSAWRSRSSGCCRTLSGCSRGSVLSRVQASRPDCREALWRTQQASRMAELLSGEYCTEEWDTAALTVRLGPNCVSVLLSHIKKKKTYAVGLAAIVALSLEVHYNVIMFVDSSAPRWSLRSFPSRTMVFVNTFCSCLTVFFILKIVRSPQSRERLDALMGWFSDMSA